MSRPKWSGGLALSMILLSAGALADTDRMAIDLSYVATMDMVSPESLPGLRVNHNLRIRVNGGILSEHRDRNIGPYADKNAMAQDIEERGEREDGVSWRIVKDGTLVRVQDFPQSTRTMTVTLYPDQTCRLNVVEQLKPGFTEYKFLRIKVHEMAYYTNYVIVSTSCRISPQ